MREVIMVVAAHPDDEVLGCGGVIAKHILSGDKVNVLFMADGVTSRSSNSIESDLKNRKESARSALDILGVLAAPVFLDLPDNKMDTIPFLDIVKLLEEQIFRIKPSTIYTHNSVDLNIDHRITHKAVMTACRPLPNSTLKNIFSFECLSSTGWFGSATSKQFVPNMFVDISDFMDLKIKALEQYSTEMCKYPHSRSVESVLNLAKYRGSSVGIYAVESFIVERTIR